MQGQTVSYFVFFTVLFLYHFSHYQDPKAYLIEFIDKMCIYDLGVKCNSMTQSHILLMLANTLQTSR